MTARLPTALLWMLIAVNIALAAYLTTRAVRPAPPPPLTAEEYEGRPLLELLALSSLNEEDRNRARAVISERLPELRAAGRKAEAAYDRFAATFEIDPFNSDLARQAARELRRSREKQWSIAVEIYIDAFSVLPQAAREEMLARRDRNLASPDDAQID